MEGEGVYTSVPLQQAHDYIIKFDSIIEHLQNVLAQGDKLLVFSSFVKHLELIENYLMEHNIAYKKLTGKDQNRQQIVTDFENNPDIKIFLLSIKAGGIGLNLTAANYVFIIDPWWNPFVEQQAIDRAHRIGQNNKVFVYRFVVKDSIEEKILALQQSKLDINKALIESNFDKQLKMNDIIHILEK